MLFFLLLFLFFYLYFIAFVFPFLPPFAFSFLSPFILPVNRVHIKPIMQGFNIKVTHDGMLFLHLRSVVVCAPQLPCPSFFFFFFSSFFIPCLFSFAPPSLPALLFPPSLSERFAIWLRLSSTRGTFPYCPPLLSPSPFFSMFGHFLTTPNDPFYHTLSLSQTTHFFTKHQAPRGPRSQVRP